MGVVLASCIACALHSHGKMQLICEPTFIFVLRTLRALHLRPAVPVQRWLRVGFLGSKEGRQALHVDRDASHIVGVG